MDTLGGYLSKILEQSWLRYCHGTHFAMVKTYQKSHVPKKHFIVKSNLARRNQKKKSTKITLYAGLYC